MRKRTGSSAGGVIVKVVPTAKGPSTSIFLMPSFQLGHAAMSDQRRHSVSWVAVVSMLCSYSHMIPPRKLTSAPMSDPRQSVSVNGPCRFAAQMPHGSTNELHLSALLPARL